VDAAGTPLGGWTREWGLVVDTETEAGAVIDDLDALVDGDWQFVNADRSGLRDAFDAAMDELTAERDVTRGELVDAIDGVERTAPGHEGPGPPSRRRRRGRRPRAPVHCRETGPWVRLTRSPVRGGPG